MKAYIRYARKEEIEGWNRPLVCVFGDELRFSFGPASQITDLKDSILYKPKINAWGNSYIYPISDGEDLHVRADNADWKINDAKIEEEWPTIHRRRFRCEEHILDVRPEDDSLSFEIKHDSSDLIRAIMAFYIRACLVKNSARRQGAEGESGKEGWAGVARSGMGLRPTSASRALAEPAFPLPPG